MNNNKKKNRMLKSKLEALSRKVVSSEHLFYQHA